VSNVCGSFISMEIAADAETHRLLFNDIVNLTGRYMTADQLDLTFAASPIRRASILTRLAEARRR